MLHTRLEVFKCGILTPLLLKEGLGVVCLNLTPNAMIFSELLSDHPYEGVSKCNGSNL